MIATIVEKVRRSTVLRDEFETILTLSTSISRAKSKALVHS